MRNGSVRNRKRTSETSADVRTSSGNVFADLDLPKPDLAIAKAELVQRIRGLLAERKLTQAQAGELLGLDQPKISGLVRGNVAGYSLDRLFRILTTLGQCVEIHVGPNRAGNVKAGRAILVRS
jgi:predicted XRE-type DNA-binding protein